MKKAEFKALKRNTVYLGAIGYGPHRKRVQFSLYQHSHIFGDVTVYGHGHKGQYHYRSIQLQPHVSAVLLKESNNKK